LLQRETAAELKHLIRKRGSQSGLPFLSNTFSFLSLRRSALMKNARFFVSFAAMMLLLGATALAETTVQHPAYLRALAELRDARAQLNTAPEHAKDTLPPHAGDSAQAAESPPDSDEQIAIAQIDMAMQDVRDASEDDGKGVDEHGPVDASCNRQQRLRLAMEKLDQAHEDIEQRQQDSFLKGYKANSAQEHIEQARRAILRALGQ
jgi:hypothetical protein